MTTAQDLMDAQCARLPALDGALPGTYLLPQNGDPLMARLSGGQAVAGLVTHTRLPAGSLRTLWSATEVFELFPLVGEHPHEGMDALLSSWRKQLAQRDVPDTDSACLVTWPSRDVHATRALLDHGFTPLSCLAVRLPPDEAETDRADAKRDGAVNIRRAEPADLDTVVELALAELDYAALVGASVRRSDAASLKRNATRLRLHSSHRGARSLEGDARDGTADEHEEGADRTDGDPVWLAERDGVPVALAECGWSTADNHHGACRLPAGRWAYVNCLSVREQERGTGIGREMMALAHEEFARAGVVGSYLYYNPPNPLSSVFWPRQGYRPLWTMWEIRPATALR